MPLKVVNKGVLLSKPAIILSFCTREMIMYHGMMFCVLYLVNFDIRLHLHRTTLDTVYKQVRSFVYSCIVCRYGRRPV